MPSQVSSNNLVMVSNRGPLSFADGGGGLVARPGAGGIVSSVRPLLAGSGATWVTAAVSDPDRDAVREGLMASEGDALGIRIVAAEIDPATYRMAYDVVSNATLWYLHHGLFDLTRRPVFDHVWRRAWDGYVETNRAFADTVSEAAPEGATVLVQDYHLALVGPSLAERRPDLATVHFSHTPFAGPDAMRVLPADVAHDLLSGITSHQVRGFHTSRWADGYRRSCHEILGYSPEAMVTPLGPDASYLESRVANADCRAELDRLEGLVGDCAMILRVDRVELSKNLLRGFRAFDELLTANKGWRERVVLVALAYASRQGVADYLAYRTEVEMAADALNEKWGRPGWQPVLLDVSDNYARSLAALTRYDVLLVNPVRDGLNLVAKEGPVLNRRHGVLALSREAGAFDEMGVAALELNPYDVLDTARALEAALSMDGAERARRSARLGELARAHSPRTWLEDQVAAARSARTV